MEKLRTYFFFCPRLWGLAERDQKVETEKRTKKNFEPHRLPLEDMEYTTLPKVVTTLKDRFESVK